MLNSMYVCVCKAITTSQINQEIDKGACTMADLKQRLGVASNCGACASEARTLLDRRAIQELQSSPIPSQSEIGNPATL